MFISYGNVSRKKLSSIRSISTNYTYVTYYDCLLVGVEVESSGNKYYFVSISLTYLFSLQLRARRLIRFNSGLVNPNFNDIFLHFSHFHYE